MFSWWIFSPRSRVMITAVKNYRWNYMVMRQVRRIPIMRRKRDFYRAGSRLSSALLLTTSRERISSRGRELAEIASARARATAVVMIKRIQSRLRKCGGDTKTESEWEGKASFSGALNSDEAVRPIYRRGEEGDPNYPGTDKQTANEVGRRKSWRVGWERVNGVTFLRWL